MQLLKNSAVGFLVSFVGSIPLGYLNIIGYEIYIKNGLDKTMLYLLGVIFIEFFVIFGTLVFANKLTQNTKLIRFIEGFSVVFMFVLAYVFYVNGSAEHSNEFFFSNASQSFFIAGVLLSCANFIQVPFWLSWNLYLLNGNYIEISNSRKYFYVFGTVSGTFSGMLVLILGLSFLTFQTNFVSKYLMGIIIPTIFVVLGMLQAIKFHKKYSK